MKTAVIGTLVLLSAVTFASWTSIGPEGGPIYCGAVVPTDPPTLYVAAASTGLPVFKSADGGESWEPAGAAVSGYPYVLVAHPTDTNTLFGVYSSQFYRTTDAGLTWSQHSLGSNTNGRDIAVNPLNPNIIYVVCYKYDAGVWRPTSAKSTNGGQSWVATVLDTLTSSSMYSCAIDPVDTNVIYMGGYVNGQSAVYKSSDCGATWTAYGFPANYSYVYSLLVSPADHNVVFAGTLYGVCRSTDAGETWTRQSTNNYNYRIVTSPDDPNIMYSAAYSRVYRSTDAGVSWTAAGTGTRGTTIRTVLAVPGESSTVYCGSTAGMFKSTDYGATWTEVNRGITIGKIPVVSVNPHQASTIHCEFMDNETFKSTDDGLTWLPQGTPLSCGNVCNIAFDLHDPQRIWMLEGSG